MQAIGTVNKPHLVGGRWVEGQGPPLESVDPATQQPVWSGRMASAEQVGDAVDAARKAFPAWADMLLDSRIACLESFAKKVHDHRAELAEAISLETGKPDWEASQEAAAMAAKVALSVQAYYERRAEQRIDAGGGSVGYTRYKPHGVAAVFGPFNLPGHLPNGHIVPALLAGNTVVFKPSEKTPLVAQRTVELWQAAGLPKGVINLVQGGREVGQALVSHPGADAVMFTGSVAGGCAISRALADRPGVMVALEMGGNNPLVLCDVTDLDAAATLVLLSAYISAGQRCTCARRLILPDRDEAQQIIEKLTERIAKLRIGFHDDDPQPFMGPLATREAADGMLQVQQSLIDSGAQPIIEMRRSDRSPALLWPGLIDVTDVKERSDEEWFGPLLQVIRVHDFQAAIDEANRTGFGLVAGLISDDTHLYASFRRKVRAGVINWNRQTTGASSKLPFGGVGQSGNFRPSGYWAADYCSYPVASLEAHDLEAPAKLPPGMGE